MITRRRATLLGGAAVLLGMATFAFAARSGGAVSEDVDALVSHTAMRMDLEVLAEAPGAVEPIRTVEVKSRASGEVLSVGVETGDRVDRGQLLAQIDPRDVQNALDQAVADLEAAEVLASTTEADRARMEALRQTRAVTQQEYESAFQVAASARAAVVRARTNLQLARERRNDVTIRAPIAGTIITDNVEPGQIIASATGNVSGGTVLFTMADLREMQVRTYVSETDIGQIQPAQRAQVTVEANPGRTFRGEVYKIEPLAVVEQNVTSFPVLVRIANPDDLLKPGMTAEVAVEIATRRDVVVVPNGAVAARDAAAISAALGLDAGIVAAGQETSDVLTDGAPRGEGTMDAPRRGVVFVQGPDGVEARRVVLGVSDWENTEVVEGLAAGERVVEISGVRLRQAQQAEDDRFRATRRGLSGGGPPGAGG